MKHKNPMAQDYILKGRLKGDLPGLEEVVVIPNRWQALPPSGEGGGGHLAYQAWIFGTEVPVEHNKLKY
jgi:hypothetical protein